MQNSTIKRIGYALLALAVVIFLVVVYKNNTRRQIPIVFSPKSMVDALWQDYKQEYLEPTTLRTLDKQQNNVTTSEGESYTMLRAVWMDDQATFDTSWKWTKDNLKRPNDHLASWLFGELPSGKYGVLTARGGANSASDADSDMALALIFANARWKDPVYLGDASNILSDIWAQEVVVIKGRPYLAADNVEKQTSQKIIINPSYLSPYAYKIFAEIDPTHDWKGVVDTSYEVIEESMTSNLNASGTAKLPPDWVTIDRTTGAIEAGTNSNLTTNYGYDALRLPWRMGLDWQWNKEPRAQHILSLMTFLDSEWNKNNMLDATYTHAGAAVDHYESPAMYGGAIGYFKAISPGNGKTIYLTKLQSLFNPDTNQWKTKLSYYDDNWAWFGIALYNDLLPNLYKQ